MIISRTPFRISFFGGGTDYPAWYKENKGAVLSTTINKYCYISCRYLPPFFEHKHRIVWSQIELPQEIDEIHHPSVRETLKFLGITDGVEIHHKADLPARSGMGSSSTFTVCLLHGLNSLLGKMVSKRQLALDAIHIEQERMKENVGSQDQVAAAFGGFNKIEFSGENHIDVHPVVISNGKLDLLQGHLMLFFTGLARTASEVAVEQIKNTQAKKKNFELQHMREMVEEALKILMKQSDSIDEFGKLLDEAWKIKRELSAQITNSYIDEIYEAGLKAGALGGKLLGAGGGGFILFFAKPEVQSKIKEKFRNLVYVPFKFEKLGSQIIYYDPQPV
jgi:D-glycero-alpha-D-manno-heptose-7-phosphate kinase